MNSSGLDSRAARFASPITPTASSTTSRPRSEIRPWRSNSSRRRLRSWRMDSTLPSGGRRCEPVDVNLREQDLRHRACLSRVANAARHSASMESETGCATTTSRQAWPKVLHCRRHTRRRHSRTPRIVSLCRRRPPQDLGETAPRTRREIICTARPSTHARARDPCTPAVDLCARTPPCTTAPSSRSGQMKCGPSTPPVA